MLFTLHITCSCIFMHTYLTFHIFMYIWTVWGFSECFFLPPLSLVYISASMAPKCKSAQSRNTLRSRASSSSDLTPSSIQFCNEDAQKNFLKNFSWLGVHSERRVILADFADTNLPDVIHNQGWELLCDIPVICPSVLIQEFYFNIYGFDFSIPHFLTCVWGTCIAITSQIVADVLRVPRVEFPDYLSCKRLRTVSKDELKSTFCEHLSDWGECQFTYCLAFAKGPQFLLFLLEHLTIDFPSPFILALSMRCLLDTLILCYSWQKWGVVLDMRVVTLRGRVSIGHFCLGGCWFLRDVVRITWLFCSLSSVWPFFLYVCHRRRYC